MRLLLLLLPLSGCWAFVDYGHDVLHAKADALRCAAECRAKGAETSFESPSTRQCGCQYDGERFSYSQWPE